METENKEKKIKSIFSKYVSKDVLNELMNNKKALELGGEEKDISILFSDIRGFTTISESTEPKILFEFLNRYLTGSTDAVIKHKGVLDKYIGDAIMAFWGAPVDNKYHADLAVDAALEMIEKLEEFNTYQKENNLPIIKIGIGINSGKAIVGNVGSSFRQDYTVIGDTVNTASRLEGATKEFGEMLIISESTKDYIINKSKYEFTYLGEAILKGKDNKIKVYGVKYS